MQNKYFVTDYDGKLDIIDHVPYYLSGVADLIEGLALLNKEGRNHEDNNAEYLLRDIVMDISNGVKVGLDKELDKESNKKDVKISKQF